MARGLDHIVHAVRDLDAGAELYRRCGFTVGARNRHSWGTHNHIVQLPGFFIEVLTLAEPDKLGDDGFSQLFGRFNGDFIKRHDGLSLMILESMDAAADRKAFVDAGISASETLKFEREGKKPDGSPVKVAFSLAFARDAKAPDAGFAVCQQHYPENFWNPAFQQHANTVIAVAGVAMVADNPSDHHVFASAFAGQRDIQSTSSGIGIETSRGQIQIMDPPAFRDHFGASAPEPGAGMRIAAIRFRARDLAQIQSALKASDLRYAEHMRRIVVAPADALGATLVFEAE